MLPTLNEVTSAVIYDKETGIFRWKIGNIIGKTAGNERKGYVRISINGHSCLAHRLAWLIVYGEWPDGEIDHINRVKNDNKISNLRVVSRKENCQNQLTIRNTNVSGYLGVSKSGNKWKAEIRVNGKRRYLGLFESPESANDAYLTSRIDSMKTIGGCRA